MSSSAAEVRPVAPTRGVDSGQVLGDRYELLEVRGSGGFSTVYCAHDRRLDTVVAVKLLDAAPDEPTRLRFELEVEIGGRVVHPRLVRIIDRGEHRGRPYAVMPLLHGTPLASRRGADFRRVCRWMRQYLDGMRALHEARAFAVDEHRTRMLHRDIKPTNCFLSTDGDVTIIDFGLVKPVDRDSRATQQGLLIGTPAYMAPECLFGQAASERSDVYSLGVTFFEMLTGERPYPNDMAQLHAIHAQTQPAPSPRGLRPELPAVLAELVQQAMAPLPAQRFASVDAMLRRLDRILRGLGEPVLATPTPRSPGRAALVLVPPPGPAAAQPPAPRSLWRTTVLLGGLAVALTVAVVLQRDGSSETPASHASARSEAPRRGSTEDGRGAVEVAPSGPDPIAAPAPMQPAASPPSAAPTRPKSASRRVRSVSAAAVRVSVKAHESALRGCAGGPAGLWSLELAVAGRRATLRRINFSSVDRTNAWQMCVARVLADIQLPASEGAAVVRVVL